MPGCCGRTLLCGCFFSPCCRAAPCDVPVLFSVTQSKTSQSTLIQTWLVPIPYPRLLLVNLNRFAVSAFVFITVTLNFSLHPLYFVCLGLGWLILIVYWSVPSFPVLAVVGRYREYLVLPGSPISDCSFWCLLRKFFISKSSVFQSGNKIFCL